MTVKTELKSESRLIYEIMQELGKYGAVYRTNSGSIRLNNGRYFRAMPEGFADIMFIRPDGGVCFVETKVGRNKASDKQLDFLEKMRRMNCRAGIAYSVDDALKTCGIKQNEYSGDSF